MTVVGVSSPLYDAASATVATAEEEECSQGDQNEVGGRIQHFVSFYVETRKNHEKKKCCWCDVCYVLEIHASASFTRKARQLQV
jgi:hypothetical protein